MTTLEVVQFIQKVQRRHRAGWECGPECPHQQSKQQMKAALLRSVPELAVRL